MSDAEQRKLVDRAALLHRDIAEKTDQLKEIKAKLAAMAKYREGGATGHVYGSRFSATVTLKKNVKWDQGKLEGLREDIGDADFMKVFTWEYKPISQKDVDAAVKHASFGGKIEECFTATEGSPQVVFKPMEDC
ncbi:MAG: hypothetical protein LBJ61_00260 [Deltaproteobacteria bacterium]|jgi:hypothetical protein|nr:hypothetical protein [Deltaproteobacteria bacterium]